MKIESFLRPDGVIAELRATEKTGALKEMTSRLAAANHELNEAEVFKALVDRERLGSTGIGNGVAIPHAKIAGAGRLYAVFARSTAGVSFDSVDGAPVHLFFLLLAPEKMVGSHLAALERISRLLQDEGRRAQLRAAAPGALYDLILGADEEG